MNELLYDKEVDIDFFFDNKTLWHQIGLHKTTQDLFQAFKNPHASTWLLYRLLCNFFGAGP